RVAGGVGRVLVRPRRGVLGGEVLGRPGVRRLGIRATGSRAGAAEGEVLAEPAHFLGQLTQPLAQSGRPVAAGEVALHLFLDLAHDPLHLLLRPVLRLLGLAAGALGLLPGAPALVLGAPGLLLPLLLGAAHLLLGGAPGVLVAEDPEVAREALLVGGAWAARLAGLAGGGPHLAAQIARRAAHVGADLGGQFGDRLADLQLQIGQLAAAVGQFGPAGVGDRVHLAAALG